MKYKAGDIVSFDETNTLVGKVLAGDATGPAPVYTIQIGLEGGTRVSELIREDAIRRIKL